jgi:hypothetical protein
MRGKALSLEFLVYQCLWLRNCLFSSSFGALEVPEMDLRIHHSDTE